MSAHCSSCNAEIEWAHTTTGGIMPLDTGTAQDGNMFQVAGSSLYKVCGPREAAQIPLEQRRRSHFATCPDRADWRKKIR